MFTKRNFARAGVVALGFAGIAAVAFAGAPPLSPLEFPDASVAAPAAGWFWTFLASPEAAAVIAALVSGAAGILVRQRWIAGWRLDRAVQCLAAGVRETYEEYVRAAQQSNADGKLTSEERDQAMRMALAKAKEYALTQGFDLAKVYAKEFLPVVVERLIGIQKASGRGLPLEPPLPELRPR